MATLTPWARSALTVAPPSPEAPPVTMAEIELSSFMGVSCATIYVRRRFSSAKRPRLAVT
jgi:hypothetical protein